MLKFRPVHGEKMTADKNAVSSEMPQLMLIIVTFTHKDVWNVNEFGLF